MQKNPSHLLHFSSQVPTRLMTLDFLIDNFNSFSQYYSIQKLFRSKMTTAKKGSISGSDLIICYLACTILKVILYQSDFCMATIIKVFEKLKFNARVGTTNYSCLRIQRKSFILWDSGHFRRLGVIYCAKDWIACIL